MYKNRLLPFVLILLLALLACGLPTAATPTQDQNAIYTAAAQTIAAQAGTPPAQVTGAPPLAPTNTEAPTLPPTPTDTLVPSATPTNTLVPSATAICDKTQFVSETIPDGSVFAPGATFIKTWRVRNVGACTWTAAYAIVYDHGDHLGAPDAIPFPGNVAPGQEVDLSINMQAPLTPGAYESYWKFRNASGVIFVVNPYWAKITVVAPTPTPTLHVFFPGPLIPLIPILFPNTQQVYNQVSVSAGTLGFVTATCPSGSVVVGGGFAAGNDMVVSASWQEGNGWRAGALNNSASSQLLNAYAVCLYNTAGSTTSKMDGGTASGGGIGHAVATCPAGSVVTGGGFGTNPTQLSVYNSSISGNGWQVYVKNKGATDIGFNAYATCLSGTSGTTAQVLAQATITGNNTGSAEVACPSGSLVTGGGFALGNNLVIYNTSMSADVTKWNSYARNTAAGDQLINDYAVCLSFP